ncbi:hypothetical protein BGZ63DRAFT_374127 [Mariannaea sp. PMI_226]|nr:hypothetical protein BGZ63DRAFT_374127 [Mariannaea sp. PMI_226]
MDWLVIDMQLCVLILPLVAYTTFIECCKRSNKERNVNQGLKLDKGSTSIPLYK